ncbi:neuronal PAS domain protein [Tasmannia lanceolata]|uniref:neuronal PAS domain protein n=1 Tax=Tasmannia lanceolata TaxID=3420 RepID=UPI004063DB91
MASCNAPDIWAWINNLPPISQWGKNSMSICICSSKSTQPSLNLSITKSLQNQNPFLAFSILADFHLPITLWTSKSFKLNTNTKKPIDEETILNLFYNFILDILNYGPKKNTSYLNIQTLRSNTNLKDMFNLSFFTLALLICIYEAPQDLRLGCLNTLKQHLTSPQSRETSKLLMRRLGSNLEEQWMRSLNLAITNWIVEIHPSNQSIRTPSPLFSYAISTIGLWKVQLYCPTIAMEIESSSNTLHDEHLLFSLRYQQLEGVIQLGYKVIFRENWIDVVVNIDNVRCDVIPLASETLMAERGTGVDEKHFPSRVSLQLTPIIQTNVLSISVGKSSENPTHEIGLEKTMEGAFDPPNSVGLRVSATETVTVSMKPWKFEQSVDGNSANLNWFLHDSIDGREVTSTKPSKMALLQPKAWFKDRYSSAYRPFTKQGGVVFAGDEYGASVWWKVDREAMGKTMEWEIKGWIWLTYWPNKYRTLYSETRRLEFREILHLPLLKQD